MSTLRECRRFAITNNTAVKVARQFGDKDVLFISPEGDLAGKVSRKDVVADDWMIAPLKTPDDDNSIWFEPNNNEVNDAIEAIRSERYYQDSKWGDSASSGEPGVGGYRTIDEFALYITEYTDQLRRECGTGMNPRSKLELVRKVGALCIAAMEWHGAPKRPGYENELTAPDPVNDEPIQQGLGSAIENVLNRYCAENESNTPDYILSEFLMGCLQSFNNSVVIRDKWYHGSVCAPGQTGGPVVLMEAGGDNEV